MDIITAINLSQLGNYFLNRYEVNIFFLTVKIMKQDLQIELACFATLMVRIIYLGREEF